MTDRPIAAVLGVIAAIVFVAAFSAAAVMRPNQAAVAENASSRTAAEEVPVATLDAPSLSPVAALPALHLPKERPPARAKVKKLSKPKVAAPASPTPAATPSPTQVAPSPTQVAPTATTPPRVVTPPRRSGGSNVGETFDSEG